MHSTFIPGAGGMADRGKKKFRALFKKKKKETSFPLLRNSHFLSYLLISDRKWTRAEE